MAKPIEHERGGTAMANPASGTNLPFLELLERSKQQIAMILPDPSRVDRVMRVARTAYQMNADVRKCTPGSILAAVMKACELNLEPGGARKHAHLVPFGGECTLVIGYQGFVELADRTRAYAAIETREIHESDEFLLRYTPEAVFNHQPWMGKNRGEIIHVYSYARKTNGALIFEVMAWEDILKVKASCRCGPAWINYPGEMAKKVVLKRMLKRQPSSVELAEATELDDSLYGSANPPRDVTPRGRGVAALANRMAEEPEFDVGSGVARPVYSEPEETPGPA